MCSHTSQEVFKPFASVVKWPFAVLAVYCPYNCDIHFYRASGIGSHGKVYAIHEIFIIVTFYGQLGSVQILDAATTRCVINIRMLQSLAQVKCRLRLEARPRPSNAVAIPRGMLHLTANRSLSTHSN